MGWRCFRNPPLAASYDVIDVWLSFAIVFCVKYLKHKSGNGQRMNDPGSIMYACNGTRQPVMDFGCLAASQEGL